MTERPSTTYLWDAMHCCERIRAFTAGRSLEDFLADDLLRSAVERQFTIMGEAFTQLRRADAALAAEVADLPDIVAFRNLLVHGYARINNQRIWTAVVDDVPLLAANLTRMLHGDAGPPGTEGVG